MHYALCTMHYAIHQAAMSDPQTNCHWISRRPLGPLGPLKVDKRAPTLSQVGPFVKSVRAGAKVDIVTNANNKMNSWCSCLNLIFPVTCCIHIRRVAKPRQRVSNADRKVFANPERICDKFIIGWIISGNFAIQSIQIICSARMNWKVSGQS